MKVQEYMQSQGLKTYEDLRLHFRANMLSGKGIVAMYSCPKCEEILNDASDLSTHKCKEDK